MTRRCPACERMVPIELWSKSRRASFGLASACKACCAARMRTIQARHRERFARDGVTVTHKLCSYCGEIKAAADFGIHRSTPTGLQHRCRRCCNTQQVLRRYGLSAETLAGLLEKQGRACAICRQGFSARRGPHVDHEHATGRVRGLLCSPCNTAIGLLREDVSSLLAAVAYIGAAPVAVEQKKR